MYVDKRYMAGQVREREPKHACVKGAKVRVLTNTRTSRLSTVPRRARSCFQAYCCCAGALVV